MIKNILLIIAIGSFFNLSLEGYPVSLWKLELQQRGDLAPKRIYMIGDSHYAHHISPSRQPSQEIEREAMLDHVFYLSLLPLFTLGTKKTPFYLEFSPSIDSSITPQLFPSPNAPKITHLSRFNRKVIDATKKFSGVVAVKSDYLRKVYLGSLCGDINHGARRWLVDNEDLGQDVEEEEETETIRARTELRKTEILKNHKKWKSFFLKALQDLKQFRENPTSNEMVIELSKMHRVRPTVATNMLKKINEIVGKTKQYAATFLSANEVLLTTNQLSKYYQAVTWLRHNLFNECIKLTDYETVIRVLNDLDSGQNNALIFLGAGHIRRISTLFTEFGFTVTEVNQPTDPITAQSQPVKVKDLKNFFDNVLLEIEGITPRPGRKITGERDE